MLIAVEQLVGAAEVAEILGVSRQRVTQLTSRPDFPAPVAVLAMGKVWTRDAVEAWAEARDKRLGRR
jgi:predicted DNA-binding transcriptional regulator AlpA